jgi:hypothetical protein
LPFLAWLDLRSLERLKLKRVAELIDPIAERGGRCRR